jgi:pimeloyl-ACP methyl ester carboxylesterase
MLQAEQGAHRAFPPDRPGSFRQVVEGVELSWSERGEGSSTIVVLHGLSDTERSWWPVMALLGQRHRVLGLDLPGCGSSARPDANYRLDWQARVVAAWLDRVDVSRCDIVGHSFGGGVAMWLLLYRANSVRRLALVAPGGLGREVALELRLAALPFVVERYGQRWMVPVMRLLVHLNGRLLSPDQRGHLLRVSALPGSARAFARTVRDVIGWRGQARAFLGRAREIQTLPAMALFWGEHDRIIPIRQGEELCATLENCTLQRFPDAGHFLHWEQPRALAEALLRFLEATVALPARLAGSSGPGSTAQRLGRAQRGGTCVVDTSCVESEPRS